MRFYFKKVLFLLPSFLLVGCHLFPASNSNSNQNVLIVNQTAPLTTTTSPSGFDFKVDENGLSKSIVIIKTTKGTLKVRLYSNDAPNTTRRFVELIKSKFYDGLTFHRVEENFVVQIGDPKSKNKSESGIGTGGSGQKLRAEFNGKKHIKGTLGMARASDPDSADSQFYITLKPTPQLDQKYTIIGQVVDFGEKSGGQDVLERIKQWDEVTEIKAEP